MDRSAFDTPYACKSETAQQEHREHRQQRAIELIRDFGHETLSFFGLAPPNSCYLAPSDDGVVNYRLAGDVAVLLGDPVCQPEAFEDVVQSFRDFCHREHWHIAIYQAHPHNLPLYRKQGLHCFKMGEEAMLHPQSFTLAGGALANVRQSSHKAERAGVTLSWYDGSPPPRILDQLKALSQIWLTETFGKGAIEMGFSLGRIREVPAQAACAEAIVASQTAPKEEVLPRLITGVACDRAGQTCAFVTCTPIYGTVETSSRAPEPSQQRRGGAGQWI